MAFTSLVFSCWLPGGLGTVHAIRLGIKPFAESRANSESWSGSRVDPPCPCRAILKSAPITRLQSFIFLLFQASREKLGAIRSPALSPGFRIDWTEGDFSEETAMRKWMTLASVGTALMVTLLTQTSAQDDKERAGKESSPPRYSAPEGRARAARASGDVKWAYFVNGRGNKGAFFLNNDTGEAIYTIPGPGTQAARKMNLNYTGEDQTGRYWQYQEPLPGGFAWFFPKDVASDPVYSMTMGVPTPHVVPFGPASRCPIMSVTDE